jgi:hypothetical protein
VLGSGCQHHRSNITSQQCHHVPGRAMAYPSLWTATALSQVSTNTACVGSNQLLETVHPCNSSPLHKSEGNQQDLVSKGQGMLSGCQERKEVTTLLSYMSSACIAGM